MRRSCTETLEEADGVHDLKRNQESVNVDALRIPYAHIDKGHCVRPGKWAEVSEERRKSNTTLQCPCGKPVIFKHGPVRSPHFAHTGSGICDYVRKYGEYGEGEMHLNAKLKFSDKDFRKSAVFVKLCGSISGCCNAVEKLPIDPSWIFHDEYRIGRWRVDVAFLDPGGNIRIVIEVRHTNPTLGDKRTYLQSQEFRYIEVGAEDVLDSSSSEIIVQDSSEGIRYCETCDGDFGYLETFEIDGMRVFHLQSSNIEVTHYPIRETHMVHILNTPKSLSVDTGLWITDGVNYYYAPPWAWNDTRDFVESPWGLDAKMFKRHSEMRNLKAKCDKYVKPTTNTIKVIQKGAGSGKTYDSVQLTCSSEHCSKTTWIYITKVHTAKQVIVDEFNDQLSSGKLGSRIPAEEWTSNNTVQKKTVLKYRGNGENDITIIIGTIDSLVWALDNYCTTKSKDTQPVIDDALRVAPGDNFAQRRNNVAYTKDVSSPTLKYANELIVMNEDCIINVDEVQDLPMEYIDIFIKLVRSTRVDFSVIGDKLQSIWYEKNIYTWLQSGAASIPYGILDITEPTNIVRRFHNPQLMDFCNSVVRFEEFGLPAIQGICPTHPQCGFPHTDKDVVPFTLSSKNQNEGFGTESLHEKLKGFMNAELEENPSYGPGDFVVVQPFVASRGAVVELPLLQTFLEDYWHARFANTDRAQSQYVFWHKSEASGEPIDLKESTGMMRFLSIHAAKGTGCSVVFLLGCSESAIRYLSPQRYQSKLTPSHSLDIIYESIINVAITRQKRSLYIQLPHFDTDKDDFVRRVLSGTSNGNQTLLPQTDLFQGGWNWDLRSLVKFIEFENFEKVWDDIGLQEEHVESLMATVDRDAEHEIVDWGEHIMRMGVLHWAVLSCILTESQKSTVHEDGRAQLYKILKTWCKKDFDLANSREFIQRIRKLMDLSRHYKFEDLDAAKVPILHIEGHDYERHAEYIKREMKNLQNELRRCMNMRSGFMAKFTPERSVMFHFTLCVSRGDELPYSPIDLYRVIDRIRSMANTDKLQIHYEKIEHANQQWKRLLGWFPENLHLKWRLPHIPVIQNTNDKDGIKLWTRIEYSGHYETLKESKSVSVYPIPTLSQQNVRQNILRSVLQQFITNTSRRKVSVDHTTTAIIALNSKLRMIGAGVGQNYGVNFDVRADDAPHRIQTAIFETIVLSFEKKHVALWNYLQHKVAADSNQDRTKKMKATIKDILTLPDLSDIASHIRRFLENLRQNLKHKTSDKWWWEKDVFLKRLLQYCKHDLRQMFGTIESDSDDSGDSGD